VNARKSFEYDAASPLTSHGPPRLWQLTHRHYAIIDYLREKEAESVRNLARELGFDKKDISEDLQLLARFEIVTLETDGRAKVPRLAKEHVFVEPLV